MSETEILELMPLILRHAASDWYDALDHKQRSTWDDFKQAFLTRFGRSEATRWRDASDLWKQSQGINETCDDYFAVFSTRWNKGELAMSLSVVY